MAASFADLRVGIRVKVKGTLMGDTVLATPCGTGRRRGRASTKATPTPEPEPERELTGAIAALAGSAVSFQFTVNAVTVHGAGSTSIDDGRQYRLTAETRTPT